MFSHGEPLLASSGSLKFSCEVVIYTVSPSARTVSEEPVITGASLTGVTKILSSGFHVTATGLPLASSVTCPAETEKRALNSKFSPPS
ncbi:hypothetical protein D3C75_472780 [compost metagenome]